MNFFFLLIFFFFLSQERLNFTIKTMTEAVKIDVTKLTPLSPEVISKQATINIGKAKKKETSYKKQID